jgi:RND family efflux transporter MFP subunit
MSRKQKLALLAVLAAAIVLALTAPEQQPELREVVPARVRVDQVTRHDLVPGEQVSGRLEPARKAALHFELSGQVDTRAVEPGRKVASGDLLLSLAAGDYRDALAEAEAQLKQEQRNIARDRQLLKLAQQNYALRKNDLARQQQLGAESLVSKSHLDEVRIQLIQLESEVTQLKASTGSADARLALKQAARNRAARNLARTRLEAPFAGTVNSVNAQAGDYITPVQVAVELIDASELDLYVEVRGEVAGSLQPGQAVDIDVDGRPLRGTVYALQTDPDPVTFTHALRVRLAADGVRPGQVAQVHLPLRNLQQVLAVPVTAVLYEEGETYLYRVNRAQLERVGVVLGQRVGEWQEVREGLQAGDRIVVRDVAALSDAQPVTVDDAPVAAD